VPGESRLRLFAECKLRMEFRTLLSVVVAFATFFPVMARAQGPPARDYLNTPIYQARFFVNFLASNAQTAASSDIPLPNNVTVSRNVFLSFLW
jgi:hypothetical protein